MHGSRPQTVEPRGARAWSARCASRLDGSRWKCRGGAQSCAGIARAVRSAATRGAPDGSARGSRRGPNGDGAHPLVPRSQTEALRAWPRRASTDPRPLPQTANAFAAALALGTGAVLVRARALVCVVRALVARAVDARALVLPVALAQVSTLARRVGASRGDRHGLMRGVLVGRALRAPRGRV